MSFVDDEGLDAYDGYDDDEDDPAWVTIEDILCKRETEKALLLEIAGKQLWFPKSQIALDGSVSHEGERGKLVCTKWIAQMKGVI